MEDVSGERPPIDYAEAFIGDWFKSDHPWSFRSGRWGRILAVREVNGRLCWQVGWEDEVSDLVVIDDPDASPHYVLTNVAAIVRGWKT